MTVRRLALPVVFVAGLALTLVATTVALGAGKDPAHSTAPSLASLRGVNFVSSCGFSHRANDDPIVSPGKPGASHDHSFVGARTTSAFSTVDSLRSSASSCERDGHTAAYWMPSLVVDGSIVPPRGATIYYRRTSLEAVSPFPAGLRMIAGSALATAPQGLRTTFWNCGAAGGVAPSTTVPDCPDGRGTMLRLHVTFPSCWNGRDLDTSDHQSHMAYPMRGRCPATHPVEVPAISLIYRYPAIQRGSSVALASGGQLSAHADFINSWDARALERLVDRCLNALRHCQRGS